MVDKMSSTEPLDTDRLSRLIELRLKETNRPEQAAAFVRLGMLRVILDALSVSIEPTSEFSLAMRLLIARHAQKGSFQHSTRIHMADQAAFLAPIDSEHHALVFDFDSVVTKLGELAMTLTKFVHSGWAPENDVQMRFCTMWQGDEPYETSPVRQRIPLQGSLAKLKPVSGLSNAYEHPDFSKNRLRPTHFLR
jgi:hypothetical protein